MQIKFFKYQGTGNDFILIDNRTENVRLNSDQIAHLCNRKFGIGADGLMLLEQSNKYDFEMKYYNSDGHLGSMCGNGGRCIVQFAKDIDLVDENVMFLAVDGVHQAEILKQDLIDLEMNDVESIKKISEHVFELNTGSPHYIKFVNSFDSLNVVEEGRVIRNAETYLKEGINEIGRAHV